MLNHPQFTLFQIFLKKPEWQMMGILDSASKVVSRTPQLGGSATQLLGNIYIYI